MLRRASLRLALLLTTLALASAAAAQSFGTNKVQYKTFHFEVMHTDHFDVYYYPAERAGADIAARLAERWYTRLSRIFDHQLTGRQPIVLYASHPDFEQTTVIEDELGEGTGGVTEPVRRRIILPLAGPIADTDHVLGHELVHAFQFDITNGPDGYNRGSLASLPLWFVEGMAEYLSLGPTHAQTAMWLRDTAWQQTLPEIRDLRKAKYFPYRWGHAFWAYVAGRWGDDIIRPLLVRAAAGRVDEALQSVLHLSQDELSREWHAAIRTEYTPLLTAMTPPAHVGTRLVGGTRLGSGMNVGPAISPDGRWVAFLSERSFFSMDLFIAERATGRIVRRLTATSSNPHYSSLQFIYSSGAWDLSSRRFVIATIAAGRPVLAIFDALSGVREREIAVGQVDEILNPSWSPDGGAIVFTGMSGGLTDLFVYDLRLARLTRLTSDAYAEIHPAWSPDGRSIAFTTDRFTSDLPTLDIGGYRLALIDPQTAAITAVPGTWDGDQINPQWSSDGASLYYLDDRGGVANIHRVTVSTGATRQLTMIATGITGITSSSPALSVSRSPAVAAFTMFDRGKYAIGTLPLDSVGPEPMLEAAHADTLPPLDRKPSIVASMLADARLGLPPPGRQPSDPYHPHLSLDGTAVAGTIGVGVNRFGAMASGGVGLAFSDMLNTRSLITVLGVNSSIVGGVDAADIAAQGVYLNRARRWNWGVVAGQVPYLTGAYEGTISADGALALDRISVYRQTEREASGVAVYPFDRARRLELQAGVTHVTFDQLERADVYSTADGSWLFTETSVTQAAPPMTLATSAVAFVNDTSHFGATSPVQGQRYRLQAAPMVGSIHLTGVMADYRRYVMPVPFYTLALRLLHYGRYGSGADDGRLFPLSIGSPWFVRGYDVNSFDIVECGLAGNDGCRIFDRLLGSRLLVANAEFRFPLLRPLGVSEQMYSPLPTEIAVFADAGTAWSRGEKPDFLGGTRRGVSSAGVAVRTNFFSFAVTEFNVVRPFDRPGEGWVFQFNLRPGF